MKLILCKECEDIIRLIYKVPRNCRCGKSGGLYLDGIMAEYWGENAIPLGFKNSSLAKAIQDRPKTGWGSVFEAFTIPEECFTMKKVAHATQPSSSDIERNVRTHQDNQRP